MVFYLFWSLLFGLRGNLLGSSGNFLLKSFSANLEFSSILAEKQNLFGLTERGGTIRLKEWSRETSFLSQCTSSLYHLWSPAEPYLDALCNSRFLFELKAAAYLLRTLGVSTLMFTSYFGVLCPDLLEKLFEFVFRMDSGQFICASTESDMISIISDSANWNENCKSDWT